MFIESAETTSLGRLFHTSITLLGLTKKDLCFWLFSEKNIGRGDFLLLLRIVVYYIEVEYVYF